jgi:hypothetical protein
MAFPYRTRNLVTRSCPSLDEVIGLAERTGWPCIDDELDERRHEVRYEIGPEVTLHYVEDQVIRMCYIYISSSIGNFAEGYAKVIEEEVDILSIAEIARALDAEQDLLRKGREIIRLGVAAPSTYDESVYSRIRGALDSPDERLREMAVWATSYSSYPQYRPLLRRVAQDDAVQRLRERAAMMLEAFDRAGVGEP